MAPLSPGRRMPAADLALRRGGERPLEAERMVLCPAFVRRFVSLDRTRDEQPVRLPPATLANECRHHAGADGDEIEERARTGDLEPRRSANRRYRAPGIDVEESWTRLALPSLGSRPSRHRPARRRCRSAQVRVRGLRANHARTSGRARRIKIRMDGRRPPSNGIAARYVPGPPRPPWGERLAPTRRRREHLIEEGLHEPDSLRLDG